MRALGVMLTGVFLTLASANVFAQTDAVVVESKEVLPGATGVRLGVYISNADLIVAIVMPLEFRTVSGGAFYANHPARGINSLGRMYHSPLGPLPPLGNPALLINSLHAIPSASNSCSGPLSRTYPAGVYSPPEAISPDGFLFASVSTSPEGDWGPEAYSLAPGTETPGVDEPSFIFRFDVNDSSGVFEVDTCCVTPANHLLYMDINSALVMPSFTKGTITLSCVCRCHGDPDCNGDLDIGDIVVAIATAFGGLDATWDIDCPSSRTDVDASGATDVIDVVRMVRVALGGQAPGDVFADPCAN